MKHIDFVLGLHCHQPVGNFPEIMEAAYQDAYLPFLEAFERFAGLKAVLHFTGPLLVFFEKNHPDYLERISTLVQEGRLEILGGGFYEPILAVIPREDAREQLARMRRYLKQRFVQDPQGIWLAERVWEPSLPSLLVESDVRYIPIDDTHFHRVGLTGEALLGYSLTEDEGRPLGVFPIDGRLRYLIPFHPVKEILEYFQQTAAQHADPLLVLVDDGEKFGVWPGTKNWVYRDGWLENFFRVLSENASWLHTVTLSESFDKREPLGRVYLPTTSYFELGEWALPVDGIRRLDRLKQLLGEKLPEFHPLLSGGYWRNFFSKYPEADYMHKRMLRASRTISALPSDANGQQEARHHLLQAQSNDAYWHGLFGGIYLPHLRDAVWQNILKAETQAEQIGHHGQQWSNVSQTDIDADGHVEVILENERWTLVLSPRHGGMLYELSDKSISFNFLNTIARRPEVYHEKVKDARPATQEVISIHERLVAKETGLDRHLIYDRYRRGGLIDHLFPIHATLADIAAGREMDLIDLVGSSYSCEISTNERTRLVRLSRSVRLPKCELQLVKEISLTPGSEAIPVRYLVKHLSGEPLRACFGVEFNFGMAAGDAPDHYFQIPGREISDRRFASSGEEHDVEHLRLVNDWLGWALEIKALPPAHLWRHPIQTVNNSETGFELLYQASAVLFLWNLNLETSSTLRAELELRCET